MPSPKNVSSTQAFVNALNVAYGGGALTFDLSQAANIIGNGSLAPARVSITLDSTAKCPTTAMWFNDQLNPSGTTYRLQLFDSGGNFAADFGQITLSGASVDLSTLIPSSTSGGTVSFSAPVLQQPSSPQVINGQPLTLEGTLLGFSTAGSTTPDASISRTAGATFAFGNGSQGDKSGTIQLSAIQGIGFKQQIFTSSGTFTIPTGVTQVKATVIAGGGGGGGADAAHNGGGGGGSGSAGIKWLSGLTPGNTLTVTIGPGGAGGASPSGTGGSGTASSVSSGTQTITTINTNGGGGGGQSLTNFPGVGGPAGTGGDLNLTGAFGGTWMPPDYGGNGAPSILGGGALGAVNAANGATGIGPGSGGSGGGGTVGNTGGGAGANGIVIFEWIN